MARFIKPILGITPVDLERPDPRDAMPLARTAAHVRGAAAAPADGVHPAHDHERRGLPRPVVRDDAAQGDHVRVGIIGTFQGVRSPGTAYVLLHHYMGEIDGAFRAWGIPRGGTGGVSEAIAQLGAQLRRRDPHRGAGGPHHGHEDGRATGVVLESGEEIGRDSVLATTDAKVTFLDLLEPGTLEPEFEATSAGSASGARRARSTWRSTGCPTSRCLPGPGEHLRGRHQLLARRSTTWSRRTTTPRAAGSAAGPTSTWSSRPWSTRAWRRPASTSISCFVQYAPYKLAEGAWDDQREAFGDAVVDTIAERAPNIRT